MLKRWVWWALGVILVAIVGASFYTPADNVGAAPDAQATATLIINDASRDRQILAPAVVVGVKATPGAAGTPGIYEPINSTGGALNTSGGAGGGGVGVGTPQPFYPNGAPANQTPVAVQGIASEAHIGLVGGVNVQVAATMVLPAQTPVAYTALDVMANSASSPVVVTFANMCRVNGGSGFILKARQTTDQSTNVAAVRWHVYHTAPTAINDNAPFTLLYANASLRVGTIDLPANATEGSGSNAAHAANYDVRMPYKCAVADTSLYMIPETLTAFTPASAQGWTFELSAAVN